MSFECKPTQHFLLWRMAVGGGEDFLTNLPADSTVRKPLVRAGLIAENKRANPGAKTTRAVTYLSLTEQGWAWCQENMTWPKKARLPRSGMVLELLLPRLHAMLQRGEAVTSLGDFISQSESVPVVPTPPRPDIHQAIRDACRDLANGREGVRIRLVDLRGRLTAFAAEEITRGVSDLSHKGELSLYRLDDPREIQPADREAAVLTSTGEEKHILYFGGMAS